MPSPSPPCVFTFSCWSSSRPRLAQVTQCQLVPEDTCVYSSHGKSTAGTTTLPKPHLYNELIAWEYFSRLVTSATLGQKSWRRLQHGSVQLPLLMDGTCFYTGYKVIQNSLVLPFISCFRVRLSVRWRRTTLSSLERAAVKHLVCPHRFRPSLTFGKLTVHRGMH